MLWERVLARRRCLVGFVKALDLLHQAIWAVYYRPIVMAIEMAIKVGTCYIIVLFAVALAAAEAIRSE